MDHTILENLRITNLKVMVNYSIKQPVMKVISKMEKCMEKDIIVQLQVLCIRVDLKMERDMVMDLHSFKQEALILVILKMILDMERALISFLMEIFILDSKY
jgi:hypothetical protein